MASLFSAGFNETVPITADEVETKKQYIHDNPRRRLLKGQLRDCFTIYRGQHSPNWTLDRLTKGIRHYLFLSRDPEALQAAVDTLCPRLLVNPSGQLVLDYIGPRDLLLSANKLPLICHRADAMVMNELTRLISGVEDDWWKK